MREKQMFAGSACAGVVAGGVACFFIGLVMLIWGVWDTVSDLDLAVIINGITLALIVSIVIWFWGWYFLNAAWREQSVKRITAYRVAGVLIIAGTSITVISMIKLLLY